ncbi:unnamed protein product [Ixodes pacificus]
MHTSHHHLQMYNHGSVNFDCYSIIMCHTGKLPISAFYNFGGFALWRTNNLCAKCGKGWGVATDVFCQPASLDEFDTNSHPGITLGFWIMNTCFHLNYCPAPFRHYNILHTSAQTTPRENKFTNGSNLMNNNILMFCITAILLFLY